MKPFRVLGIGAAACCAGPVLATDQSIRSAGRDDVSQVTCWGRMLH